MPKRDAPLKATFQLECGVKGCSNIALSYEPTADMALVWLMEQGWREATVAGKDIVACPYCVCKLQKRRY